MSDEFALDYLWVSSLTFSLSRWEREKATNTAARSDQSHPPTR